MRMHRSATARWVLAVAGMGLIATFAAFGQGNPQNKGNLVPIPQTTNAPPPVNRAPAQIGRLDDHFAACLVWQNENEVAAARLAEQKSGSAEVRDFAKAIAKDHSKFINELEPFAGQLTRIREPSKAIARDPGRNEVPAANPPAVTAEQRARPGAPTTLNNAAQHDEMLQIKAEMADACRASVEKELNGKSGNEFDDCFVGMQIAAHMQMVDELKVLERHASPQLQPVLKQGRTTAEAHLDRAKSLMKSLDKAQTAQKSTDSTIK